MMLMLSGCATSTRPVALQTVPVLPSALAVTPPDPGVRAGRDARLELARSRAALAQCRGQYEDFKGFYERLRKPVKGARR